MFNYDFLSSDHMAKVSNQAKLYYIELNFFTNDGFVPNPLKILDSLGYDKSVFMELVANGEILTIPDRSEIFITSYYIHNKGIPTNAWWKSPFSFYWKGKLSIKRNGIATLNPDYMEDEEEQKMDKKQFDPLDTIVPPTDEELAKKEEKERQKNAQEEDGVEIELDLQDFIDHDSAPIRTGDDNKLPWFN